MVNNDEKILKLKERIEEKKKKIAEYKKFSPITNCSLELEDKRHNIQALNKESAFYLLLKINLLKMSADNLKVFDYVLSGYKLEDWMDDLKNRVNSLVIIEEKTKLKALEKKLDTMLSNEKKTELELNEIESLLGE